MPYCTIKEAEMPFLKGIEVLPPEESAKARSCLGYASKVHAYTCAVGVCRCMGMHSTCICVCVCICTRNNTIMSSADLQVWDA